MCICASLSKEIESHAKQKSFVIFEEKIARKIGREKGRNLRQRPRIEPATQHLAETVCSQS